MMKFGDYKYESEAHVAALKNAATEVINYHALI